MRPRVPLCDFALGCGLFAVTLLLGGRPVPLPAADPPPTDAKEPFGLT